MSNIELYQGDCLEVMKNIPDNSINCIVTSPPYNKKYFANQKRTNQIWSGFQINYNSYDDNLPIEEYEEWMVECLNTMFNKLSLHGSLFFNHKPIRYKNKIYHPLQFILQSNCPIYQEIIWDRKNSPNIRNDVLVPCTERIYWITKGKPIVHRDRLDKDYYSEVWKISASKDKKHPAPFPEQLVKNCIFLSSEEDNVILDPFMGCGTTGLSCLNTNRNFIGIELDKDYFAIAENRIKQANKDGSAVIRSVRYGFGEDDE